MALGARRVVGLDVPALRVYGAVHVVDADDLRFRSWEVERLFRDFYRDPVPPGELAVLARRTEGWAAGSRCSTCSPRAAHPHSGGGRWPTCPGIAAGPSYRPRGARRPACRAARVLRRTSALGVLTGPVRRAARHHRQPDRSGGAGAAQALHDHTGRRPPVPLPPGAARPPRAGTDRAPRGRGQPRVVRPGRRAAAGRGRGAGGVPCVRARRRLGGRRTAAAPARRRGRRRSAGATGEHAAARPGRQRPVAAARAGPPARGRGCADRGGGGVPARPLRRGGQPARGPLSGGAHRRAVVAGRDRWLAPAATIRAATQRNPRNPPDRGV